MHNGTYFLTGGPEAPMSVRYAAAAEDANIAFFTPVAGFQRMGYQCVPLVEISKINGRVSKRQGTACRAVTAQ